MFFYRYLGEQIEASALMEGARAIEEPGRARRAAAAHRLR